MRVSFHQTSNIFNIATFSRKIYQNSVSTALFLVYLQYLFGLKFSPNSDPSLLAVFFIIHGTLTERIYRELRGTLVHICSFYWYFLFPIRINRFLISHTQHRSRSPQLRRQPAFLCRDHVRLFSHVREVEHPLPQTLGRSSFSSPRRIPPRGQRRKHSTRWCS